MVACVLVRAFVLTVALASMDTAQALYTTQMSHILMSNSITSVAGWRAAVRTGAGAAVARLRCPGHRKHSQTAGHPQTLSGMLVRAYTEPLIVSGASNLTFALTSSF